MSIRVGKIVEVFIPEEEQKEIINSSKIGFKILVDDEILEIIEEQDSFNSHIYKNDMVVIEVKMNSSRITIINVETHECVS